MTIVKCDRCQALDPEFVIAYNFRKDDLTLTKEIKFDLCSNCLESFGRWLRLEDVSG